MITTPLTLTYPVPLAFSLIGGVLLAAGLAWGALPLLLGFAGVLLVTQAWPGRAALLLLCAVLAGAGYWRQVQWQQPNVLAPWQGAIVTLRGDWDGQFLHLTQPRAVVALAPKPAVPPGALSVRGVLVSPEGRRTPGGFDYAAWLQLQGVQEVLVGAEVRRSDPERGLRGWFRRGLSAHLSPQHAALMRAIELGERSDISRETSGGTGQNIRDEFTRSGLAHLMALSGQNVALIVGLLTWMLVRALPLRLTLWRYPLLIAAVAGFVWLVGPSPSIVRAALMATFALAGLWLGRGKLDALGVLALAAIASLLYQSAWLFDVGFQLSFLAVLGLGLSPQVARLLPRSWPYSLRLALVVTPCAEFATLPVVLHNFGQLPLLSYFANLLAGTLMAALVPLGFVAGLLGPAAVAVNWLVGWLAAALLWVVDVFGAGPQLSWGNISPAGFAAYAVFALVAVLALYRRVAFWVLPVVMTILIGATTLPPRLHPPREVVFLDVGQGDSTLVRLPHLTMLLDGGGTPQSDYDVGARTVLPALRALGVRSLNVVVATHADADHIEGLISVLRGIPVAELWIGQPPTEAPNPDPNLSMLLRVAQERGVQVRQVRRGDTVKQPEATLTVLWPRGTPWSSADNENSVVVRLDSPHFHTAVLGDLPDPLESMLGVGKLDVLKTAHHGSRFSTSSAFLQETRPHDAVISVGRNTYGHPSDEVLGRLQAAGVRVWRTDQMGTVRWPF